MKAINRFKNITAALAVMGVLGLGQSYAQTAPKKIEKAAKKTEHKTAILTKGITTSEAKAKKAPTATAEKKNAALKPQVTQTKKVSAKEPVHTAGTEKAVKQEVNKTQKTITAVKKETAVHADRATREKYNGHTVYAGPKGGRYYMNANGNKTYLSDKK
ncbi:hypothetical protein K7A41_00850 [Sphingobacterium sp. InxBP1]|uniref:hypothetical protein n=1 Tax=Sphingobacterium sp. InxBP1 TaxID=2870328 RepID=UPI002243B7CB|nr:hypothetical protein [Sphingobacterium sp. InxBP1]MCW8309767.1 hypothetical protein [Sphingobacterium sp. InxBP1]